MHIAIDARIINSSTGRYVERLLHYLELIDKDNDYTVLVRDKDLAYWTPTNDNFQVKVADFDNYSVAEQTGFKRFLDNLKPPGAFLYAAAAGAVQGQGRHDHPRPDAAEHL